MNLFTKRLTELIESSGKKQNEICSDLKISKQKLSKWKTGYNEPCLDEIIILSAYFGVSSDYLLGIEDDAGIKTHISNSFNNFKNTGTFNNNIIKRK